MSAKAKFVTEIVVKDPDTGNLIEMEVYKHQGGGMFAIDTSFLDELTQGEEIEVAIPDPFTSTENPRILYLEE